MNITIDYMPETDSYEWALYDGPDGIDDFCGRENSLGQVFEKIIYYRTLIEGSYTEATQKEHCSSGELKETTLTIVFAIRTSKYGWLTAQQIAGKWNLNIDKVIHILENNSQFLCSENLHERFYTTKERYFRWRNFMHIIGDFLTQKINITN
jgi:hypothetical protein